MSVPVATTTLRVERRPQASTDDFYDQRPPAVVVVAGVPAHISEPRGSEIHSEGRSEQVHWPFQCDPCDVTGHDEVVDETTGHRYQVAWVKRRVGFGLDHMSGEVTTVQGVQ